MKQDRRNSYRCTVLPDKDQAILHVGRRQIRSKLIEESAGGFTLAVKKTSICKPGDRLLLEVASGRYKVQVMHCTEEEGAGRIGLQRLVALSGTANNLTSGRRLSDLRGKALIGTAVLLPILLSVFGIFPGQSRSSAAVWSIHTADVELGPIGQFWRDVKGLDSLHDPEVADMLQLTNNQRTNIDYVYYEASVMLGALHDEVGDDSPQVWQRGSTQAIELAVRRIINNMTDEQVEQWIDLLRKPTPRASDLAD